MSNNEGQALESSASHSQNLSNNNDSSSFNGKFESTVTTELNKSLYTFNWRITNFDIICPQDCNEFETLTSPVFTAGEDIGKKSSWYIKISGISKHIACFLKLDFVRQETGATGPTHQSQDVTCSYKMSFRNNDNHVCFSHSAIAHKFTYDADDWGWKKFISITELYEKKATLLQNQTVCICVQMEIFGDPINTHTGLLIKRKPNIETVMDAFLSDMEKLFNNKKHADVKIFCGERTFYAHKNVLSTRSKVFSAMINSKMKESTTSQVHLTDMDPDTAHCVLTYIYTGKVTLTANTSYTELIYGAEKYDLPHLKNYCFDCLLENVTRDTIGTLAVTAYTYNAEPELRKAVKNLCQENIASLQKNPAFRKLIVEHPRAFWDD